MANWCNFNMILKTNKKDNIEKFLRHIQKDGGNYNNYKYLVLPRLAYDSVSEIFEKEKYYYLSLSGECAWSCAACMLSLSKINYNKLMKSLPNLYSDGAGEHIISIEELCAIYNTEAEIVGRELGIGFTEHYYINNKGKVIISETKNFNVEEIWCENPAKIPDDYDLVIKVGSKLERKKVELDELNDDFQEYEVFIDITDDELPF